MPDPTISDGPPSAGPAPDLDLAGAVSRQNRCLLGELAAGAVVSAAGGAAIWLIGRRRDQEIAAQFGRQTVGWAAIDAAIAALGRRGLSRPAADEAEARSRARRIQRLTLINAVADVGYVGVGAALTRGSRRRGDGLAVIVQGLFLLWLDVRHTRRFRDLAAGAPAKGSTDSADR